MALRHLWFLVSLAAAVVVAVLSPAYIPAFIDWASGNQGGAFGSLFGNDLLLHIGTGLAVGSLILFVLFYLGLTAFDGLGTALARRRLNQEIESTGSIPPADMQQILEDYPALEAPAGSFVAGLQQYSNTGGSAKGGKVTTASARSAHYYFSPHKIIHARTYRWFFDPLPLLLIAVGTALVMIKAASALGQRSGPSLTDMVEPQIVGLLLLTTAALMIFVVKRIVLGVRYQQTIAFCDLVDTIFPTIGEVEQLNRLETITRETSKSVVTAVHGVSKEIGRTLDSKLKDWEKASEKNQQDLEKALVNGLEGALKQPISALTKASERTGQDIAAQSKDALEAVLNTFLKGLEQNFSKQTKDLKSTIEETEKAAKDMHKAYRESLDQHHKSVQESLEAYAGSFGQTAASFESLQAAVDNLVTLTTPLLRQMISHQEGLLEAMEQESSSSKVIGRAASELSLAAQASRDTVEQFVTLAERLREASKAIGVSGNGSGGSRGNADKALVQQLRALKTEVSDTPEQ